LFADVPKQHGAIGELRESETLCEIGPTLFHRSLAHDLDPPLDLDGSFRKRFPLETMLISEVVRASGQISPGNNFRRLQDERFARNDEAPSRSACLVIPDSAFT
jgi:hypothetical protein